MTNELIKQKKTERTILWLLVGEGWWEGIVREFGGHVHTAIFKMDNQQGEEKLLGRSFYCFTSDLAYATYTSENSICKLWVIDYWVP